MTTLVWTMAPARTLAFVCHNSTLAGCGRVARREFFLMSRSTRRRRRKFLYLAAAALLAAIAVWVGYLDWRVTREFRGRLWSVPAHVYAAPVELYVGAPVSANDLDAELRRLQYRRGDPAAGPGLYRRRGDAFEVHTRRTQFADALREPRIVEVTADASAITALRGAGGSDLPVFRLDPQLIGSLSPVHGDDRIVLTPAEVPPLLRAGIVAVEDRRFYEHHGIDVLGILRAFWADVRAGRVVQGGSTLTQQLVKNYFLTDEQTIGRKLTEAMMAVLLEAHVSKEDILVAYLNEVYLGQDGSRAIHGFGLGSEYYFAKPLPELDAGELALLIGMVRGPSYYDPRVHPDRARERRNLVLQQLGQQHLLSAAAANRAAASPLGIKTSGGTYLPAYLDLVRRSLHRDFAATDLAAAGLSVYTSLDLRAQAAAQRALNRNLTRLDAARKVRGEHLEGAVIVADPNSGDVIAVVGGRELGAAGFDRALDARRQIGSLVKPAVYLTALETGRYNAATLIEDAPIAVKLGDGSTWAPRNFERRTYGQVPLARALAESMNLATVRLGLDLGLQNVVGTLQRLGLKEQPTLHPSLLLGTTQMTPLQVLQIYTSLANGGFRSRLRAVRAVLDENGRPLKTSRVRLEQVAPPDAVYQLDRMMTLVTTRGTARGIAARLPAGIVVAGKTGTTSDNRDSWFAGFTGNYVAVAWVGYDDDRGTGLTGAAGALPVWADTLAQLRPASFEPVPPERVEDRWIGYDDGLETNPACNTDAVLVSVPQGTVLPPNPQCGVSPSSSMGDKIKSWIKNVLHGGHSAP